MDAQPADVPEPEPDQRELALVMSGGGARAAYQVGFLRFLARRFPELRIPIVTGVSAGAINAGHLGTITTSFAEKVDSLTELWSSLTPDKVFRVDTLSLAANVVRTGAKLVSGGALHAPHSNALVDTQPLHELLMYVLGGPKGRLIGVEENLKHGRVRAVAITTSSYSTGQSITWVQGRAIELWERAHRKSVRCELNVSHILASASLPMFFPAVQIAGQWYGDGGIRMTAPLSPAIHLGAGKILAISTRYGGSRAEADKPVIEAYPPPAQIIGVLFNAIFLDVFDADALSVERVNQLIQRIPRADRDGLRTVDLLVLRPSRDLGKLANEYEARLPGAFRFLTRGLGTRDTRSNDLLSLVMFQPDYLSRLIEIGEQDAEARADEIERFLAS